ncbi:MAG: M48 family peptidase [Balneolaceae bacterium]|nr:MAG: M48 family peptidase [Balneolaceae bacterium]
MMSSLIESGITIDVNRKKIKNMYLRVYLSEGRVVLSCPWHVSEGKIRTFIRERIQWVKKHLEKRKNQVQKEELRYVTGDELRVWGLSRSLMVYETSKTQRIISVSEEEIMMFVKGKSTPEKRKQIMEDWYRSQLKEMIRVFISKWEPLMGVKVREFGVKKMKTRWGTCNIRDRRIWLNLELAKLDVNCLECVVVHEMVHLLERHHSDRFYRLMDQFLPDWTERERLLCFTGFQSC